MSHQTPTIPAEVARHVLWQFDADGGWQPGSFTQHLMNALCAADVVNFHQIQAAYPDYGAAVTLAKNDPQGITHLQYVARGEAA